MSQRAAGLAHGLELEHAMMLALMLVQAHEGRPDAGYGEKQEKSFFKTY